MDAKRKGKSSQNPNLMQREQVERMQLLAGDAIRKKAKKKLLAKKQSND